MTDAAARPRLAVFLDRDGVLVDELDFLTDPDELRLLPGAADAVRALNQRGVPVVVITNQSAVARGLIDLAGLDAVHERLRAKLAEGGAHVDAIFFCPHHPTAGDPPWRTECDCRKPRPGLLERAARALGLDLARSYVIGDSLRDLEAGAAVGAHGILVATGKGRRELERLRAAGGAPPHTARDVRDAVQLVLRELHEAHS